MCRAFVGPHGHLWAESCGPSWDFVGRALVVISGLLWAPLGPCGPGLSIVPWALAGRALVGPLGLCGPDWALVCRALVGSPGPLRATLRPCGLVGPCGLPWALVCRSLVGPPWTLMGRALVGPPWGLFGRALVGALGPYGPRSGD